MSVTLLHGDCLDIMPALPEKSVQMVFADLPYQMKNYHSSDCSWDRQIDLGDLWRHVHYCTVKNAAYAFMASQPFTTAIMLSNLPEFRTSLVWDKTRPGNFVRAKFAPMKFHEDIIIFAQEQPTYNPQMILRDKPIFQRATLEKKRSKSGGVTQHSSKFEKVYTHRYPSSIISASMYTNKQRGLHPTQKPIELLEYLIRTYTNEGDTILDPTAGSGTTAIAALRTGRNVVCIEKDKTYYDIMCKRVTEEQARLVQ